MTTFYFVRHAHAKWIPTEERPLSASGLEKARDVGRILKPYPIDAIYASPYRRAFQTVEPLSEQVGLEIDIVDELRERQLAGTHFDEVEEFSAAIDAVWQDPHFAHPGGESNMVAQQRGVALINGLTQTHPAEHIVLASHGNLLALILQHFDPTLGFEFWESMSMPDIYRVDLAESRTISRLWAEQ